MCHKETGRTSDVRRQTLKTRQQQSGYLMPLAAFILVVMGLAAVALTRSTSQTAISVSQEAITLQAFYAAETGAQMGMNNLFYDTGAVLIRADTDARCNNLNIANQPLATVGLNNCQVSTNCVATVVPPAPDDTTSFYTITSTGNCGSGEVTSTRTVQVSAFFESST